MISILYPKIYILSLVDDFETFRVYQKYFSALKTGIYGLNKYQSDQITWPMISN